jgi:uncharacterized protein YbaR (Trm112 family)
MAESETTDLDVTCPVCGEVFALDDFIPGEPDQDTECPECESELAIVEDPQTHELTLEYIDNEEEEDDEADEGDGPA